MKPMSQSNVVGLPYRIQTLPGTLETYIGSSLTQSVVVDMLGSPYNCAVVKECCANEVYALCYGSGEDDRFVTITRLDQATGWGQRLRLSCTSKSLAQFSPPLQEVRAGPLVALQIMETYGDVTSTTLLVSYQLGNPIGTCTCARLLLQIKDIANPDWRTVTNTCNDVSQKQCMVPDLQPYTKYYVQMQVQCQDPSLASDFLAAPGPITTSRTCYGCDPNPPKTALPVDIALRSKGSTWVVIEWYPGDPVDMCGFVAWLVDFQRLNTLPPIWTEVVECRWIARDAPSCNITGLDFQFAYAFRVQELCRNSKADSDKAVTDGHLWTSQEGKFLVNGGPSGSVVKEVNALVPPHRCRALKQPYNDDYSICYGAGRRGEHLVLERADKRLGWAQDLWLQCFGPPIAGPAASSGAAWFRSRQTCDQDSISFMVTSCQAYSRIQFDLPCERLYEEIPSYYGQFQQNLLGIRGGGLGALDVAYTFEVNFTVTGFRVWGSGQPFVVRYTRDQYIWHMHGCEQDLMPLVQSCIAYKPTQRGRPCQDFYTRNVSGLAGLNGQALDISVDFGSDVYINAMLVPAGGPPTYFWYSYDGESWTDYGITSLVSNGITYFDKPITAHLFRWRWDWTDVNVPLQSFFFGCKALPLINVTNGSSASLQNGPITAQFFRLQWAKTSGLPIFARFLGCETDPWNRSQPLLQASVQLLSPTTDAMFARFNLGDNAPCCRGARPDLQFRANSSDVWISVAGNCTTLGTRGLQQCSVQDLQRDTLYYARIRLACDNDNLSSSFVEAAAPVATLAGEAAVLGGLSVRREDMNASMVAYNASEEAHVRRLSEFVDLLASGLRLALAEQARVSLAALVVNVSAETVDDPAERPRYLVDYRVAVAGVGFGAVALVDAEAWTALVQTNLAALDTTTFGGQLGARLGVAVTIEGLRMPWVTILQRSSPICPEPIAVPWADVSWAPSTCVPSTWASPACKVPCQPNFVAAGEYVCTAEGVWEGGPRCIPQWLAGNWSSCLSGCGNSMMLRNVTCSSGDDRDCEGKRPADEQPCWDVSACFWKVGPWSPCSMSCGVGTRNRWVVCPSGNPADCWGAVPSTVELCRETSSCIWLAGAWSTCSSNCGAGTQTREVWCSSGSNDDCQGLPLESRSNCYATYGCAWTMAPWSSCSTNCGRGIANRSIHCPSGVWEDCPSPAPLEALVCHETSGCSWSTSAWSPCSKGCGAGIQTRVASCSSGDNTDCFGLQKPVEVEACYEAAGCQWIVGVWASCSVTCGEGLVVRAVTCPSGEPEDCLKVSLLPASSQPCNSTEDCSKVSLLPTPSQPCNSTEACNGTSGCAWTTTGWSACNSTCGEGYQTRTAKCVPLNATECQGAGPCLLQPCRAPCVWAVGNWSQCSSQCGQGLQTRSVRCPSGSIVDCPGPSPSASQVCINTTGCTWNISEWGACSTSCGNGLRRREVVCPSGINANCGKSQPLAIGFCRETSGCTWQVGDWSYCSSVCGVGLRNRSVTCSGQKPSDCAALKPTDSAECRGTEGCAWVSGNWSLCSSFCGSGVQRRPVQCSSGNTSDCLAVPPPAVQPCHDTSACSWTVGEWSNCSDPCGPGSRARDVQCTSGDNTDCAQLQRPFDRQPCDGAEAGRCGWLVGNWSNCSVVVCGGLGQRLREVTCPSDLGDLGCASLAQPLALELCLAPLQVCAWIVSSWSGCQAACSLGEETRSVSCPSGAICEGAEPENARECNSIDGCQWSVGDWSACNAPCGAGVETRDVTCLVSGACQGAGPVQSRPCRSSEPCTWSSGPWSECSTPCGRGFQSRDVGCSSGVDSDCAPLDRPIDQEECLGTWDCAWIASYWSLCNTTCGSGTQQRSVVCPGGADSDCTGTAPPAEQPCTETIGCMWRVSPWSACSANCGPGIETRAVRCSSGNSTLCPGSAPLDMRACQTSAGCGWTVGSWSECNTSCGTGMQHRDVACLENCSGENPATWQYCHEVSGCRWTPDTPEAGPEACSGDCAWNVSQWSACAGTCGAQTRQVVCVTGVAADCLAPTPVATRTCNTTECANSVASEALTFVLRIALPGPLEDAVLPVVLAAVRTAVALALGVGTSAVQASAADAWNAARRLDAAAAATTALLVQVNVTGATLAATSLITSDVGQALVAKFLLEEAVAHGINIQGWAVAVQDIAGSRTAAEGVAPQGGVQLQEPAAAIALMPMAVGGGVAVALGASLLVACAYKGRLTRVISTRRTGKISATPADDATSTASGTGTIYSSPPPSRGSSRGSSKISMPQGLPWPPPMARGPAWEAPPCPTGLPPPPEVSRRPQPTASPSSSAAGRSPKSMRPRSATSSESVPLEVAAAPPLPKLPPHLTPKHSSSEVGSPASGKAGGRLSSSYAGAAVPAAAVSTLPEQLPSGKPSATSGRSQLPAFAPGLPGLPEHLASQGHGAERGEARYRTTAPPVLELPESPAASRPHGSSPGQTSLPPTPGSRSLVHLPAAAPKLPALPQGWVEQRGNSSCGPSAKAPPTPPVPSSRQAPRPPAPPGRVPPALTPGAGSVSAPGQGSRSVPRAARGAPAQGSPAPRPPPPAAPPPPVAPRGASGTRKAQDTQPALPPAPSPPRRAKREASAEAS